MGAQLVTTDGQIPALLYMQTLFQFVSFFKKIKSEGKYTASVVSTLQ